MALNLMIVVLFIIDFFIRVAAGFDEVSVFGLILSLLFNLLFEDELCCVFGGAAHFFEDGS